MSCTQILIADDHEVIRRQLRSLIESHSGWQVCAAASDGKQAVEKAIEFKPSVAVLDISMPEMDGLQATRLIRQKANGCQVVVISQNDPLLMEKVALQAGAKRFIPKSKISQDLIKSIEALLHNGDHRPDLTAQKAPQNAPPDDEKPTTPSLFKGEGEMARIMHSTDWSKTPLGPVELWSYALRMMVNFLVPNRFPQLLWWGPEFCCLYNDAYIPILGDKHPSAIGQPVAEVWNEIWEVLRPLIETPFHGGPATWMEDIELVLKRHGFEEETHFTIAYSPVPDETMASGIGGVLATVNEITEKVIGERRISVLRELGVESVDAKSGEDACVNMARVLGRHEKDVPFALLYLFGANAQTAHLACSIGVNAQDPALKNLDYSGSENKTEIWPVAELLKTETIQLIENLEGKFKIPPSGASFQVTRAAVVPLRSNLAHQLAGFMVLGISPRLPFNEGHRNFFELLSTQVATTIANARAYEEESKKAEALAEIDRAKTAFFSNVSHEFRTPLTLMMGPLEDLIADPDGMTAQSLERVDLAHRNSLRLLKLVNALLDFSRIEAGRIQASYEPTDLAAFTAALAGMFRSAFERARLRLTVNCPPLSEAVYIDHEMWEKIVFNLLSNAFKFTFEGEIEVSLRQAGPNIEFTVRDTGTGIPSYEIPRLFKRFHRVKGAHGRSYEGSGIGLSLVQELAKFHGGSVHVESEMGKGSKFTVSIPFGKGHLPADRIGNARPLPALGSSSEAYLQELRRWFTSEQDRDIADLSSTGLRLGPIEAPKSTQTVKRPSILLADDNSDMRDYVGRLLSEQYDVITVGDGEAALQHARENRPDLILSDVMMPKLDGFGVLQRVRADVSLKDIPVILLSARAGEESKLEGLSSGADDYLIKPFSARELLARVKSHLAMSQIRLETTKKEREQRLNDEMLAAIVSSSDDAIVSKNLDGVITSWNKGAERIFGYTAKEAIGQNIRFIIPSDRQEEENEILARLKRGDRVDHFETIRMRKDGTTVDISVTISPLKDSTGNVVGASKVARDISKQKLTEQILREGEERYRKLARTLEAEVRARTDELESQNAEVLRQSELLREFSRRLMHMQDEERRRMARELHDSAGQTLTILGMNLARLVQKAARSSPDIASEAENTQELVQQLHREIRTTSYLLHPPLLDESGLASALSWYIQGVSERSGIDIALNIPEDFGRLPRDMELVVFRLVQECLTNIHRHSGSKSATIKAKRDAEQVIVEVRDQGKGITPERLAEIQSQNSGVGIRGMRERLRQFRGEMSIHSNGSGTTILVTIPISEDFEAGQYPDAKLRSAV
jgi:PAS domain S-box-containing protein